MKMVVGSRPRVPAASGVFCLLVWSACSGGNGDGPVTASARPRENVLVIDDGFDLSVAELNRNVVAAFTRECPGEPTPTADGDGGGGAADGAPEGDDGGSPDGGGATEDGGPSSSFDKRKREYIASLMSPRVCHLRSGIDAKAAPLAGVRRYRDRWNAMLRQQRYGDTTFTEEEWVELSTAIVDEYETFDFHGTTTAGTVAHGNPRVRLVLVEIPLGSAQENEDSFQCLTQTDIDEGVALALDPEVRAAFLGAPLSQYTQEMVGLIAQYNVGIVNESFGERARAVIEQMQLARGCAPIALTAYFSTMGELDSARRQLIGPQPLVTVRSAGNDATVIDSPADDADCTPDDDRNLLVGSTDLAATPSTFSNRGACVDVYAPGEDIIAPYGGGWLLPVQGTSYSAPLVARLISLTPLSPFDPQVARQRLLSQRDAFGVIPVGKFPRDLFYAPQASGTRLSALTSSFLSSRPGDTRMRRADLRRIDWMDPTLWPLRHRSLR